MSMPTITHTGALMVFSTLLSIRQGFSLALASSERTNTRRAGLQLALVAAIFIRSYSSRSVLSLTSRFCQALLVRALMNSCSRAGWLMCVDMVCSSLLWLWWDAYCGIFTATPAGAASWPLAVLEMMVMATRRFWARPSGVSLSAVGLVSPRPTATRRSGAMPFSMNRRTMLTARAADSSQLDGKNALRMGVLSVKPSTRTWLSTVASWRATSASRAGEVPLGAAWPAGNSAVSLISICTPSSSWRIDSWPPWISGARLLARPLDSVSSLRRSFIRASLLMAVAIGRVSGISIMVLAPPLGGVTWMARLPLRKASVMALDSTRYLPSLTCAMAYITTKKANSRVM